MNTENRYQETDLGNVSPNPRGEYTPGTEYEYLDLVTFDGGSYICIAELGTTTSISPESGKNTDFWQCMTIPGDMTPEYVAMHDRVVNLSEQVEADAEEVRTAEQNVSGMKENVTQMQEQTRQSAESAERSKDSAAGYADSADASRQAAETSEQNINAQVAGFDAHVDEKTSESNQIIEAARIAANKAILAQQEQSVNEVARAGGTAVLEAQAAARVATEKASAASESEKNAKASEVAAKLSEENATKMAEQVATDKEQVAYDRTAVENAKQEMTGSVAQIEQNTQGITELKGDLVQTESRLSESLTEISDMQKAVFEVGGIVMATGIEEDSEVSRRSNYLKVSDSVKLRIKAMDTSGNRFAIFMYDKYKKFIKVDITNWNNTLKYNEEIIIHFDHVGYVRVLTRNHTWGLPIDAKYVDDYAVKDGFLLEYEIYPEMFGAVGDGISDDTNAIEAMFSACDGKKCVLNGKYKLSRYVSVNDKHNFMIDGNGYVYGFGSNGEKSESNVSLITFTDCSDFEINKITVDCKCDWVARPYGWEETHSDYIDKREKSYNALKFSNCSDFLIRNITDMYCTTGLFITSCKNVKVENCTVKNTLADGCFVAGSSNNITVYGLYGENIGDDFLSADGYTTDKNSNPKHITFNNCKVKNGYGSLTCLEGCSYCSTTNCIGENIQYTPIKFGELATSSVVAPASDLVIAYNYISCKDKIQGAVDYSNEESNHSYCGGNSNNVDRVRIEGNTIISDIITNNQWNITKINKLTFKDNHIHGFNLIFEDSIYVDIMRNDFIINTDKYMIIRENNTGKIFENRFLVHGTSETCIMIDGNNPNFTFSDNSYEKSEGTITKYVTNYSNTQIIFNDKGLYVPISDMVGKIEADGIFNMSVSIDPSKIKDGQLVLHYDKKLGFIKDGEFIPLT